MKRPRERCSDILDVRTLQGEVNEITNDIATFLAPVEHKEFIESIYQRKALAVKVTPKGRDKRVARIKEVLNDFNPTAMLHESNSESISVWMGQGETIHSVKAQSKDAKGCYDAGCGLYFRASEDLEGEFIPAYSEALGHSFASYFRDGQRRGEIETFATHVGHTTRWHWDFQENFTVQLRGAKKWFLYPASVEHTHRAYAPHFNNTSVLNTQLQIARCENVDFHGIPEDIDTACETVILQPGDVLYHPAGMWHKVETMAVGDDRTNSLSINISLFPQTWSDFFQESLQQVFLSMPEMRAMMRFDSTEEAHQKLEERLSLVAKAITGLRAPMLIPRAVTSPVGIVEVRSNGVSREDGKESGKVPNGPWKRSPMGALSKIPAKLFVPLRQRPAHGEGSSSDDDDDGDDGSVPVPEGALRFDFLSNFVCEEGNVGMPPSVHTAFVAYDKVSQDTLTALSIIGPGSEVKKSHMGSITGLASVLLDIGFMA